MIMPAIGLRSDLFNHDAQASFFPDTHTSTGFDIYSYIKCSGKNLLIQGIRGTGKTHILRMIHVRCLSTYAENKVFPVYIPVASEIGNIDTDNEDLFRIHLCAKLVRGAISTSNENRDKIILQEIDDGIARSFADMYGIPNNNITEVLGAIETKQGKLVTDLVSYSAKMKKTSKKMSGDEPNLYADIKGFIGASLRRKSESSEEVEEEISRVELFYKNTAKFLTDFFSYFQQIIGCRFILLLLDECNIRMDKPQLEIYRLLKFLRGCTISSMSGNYIYFCASFYPQFFTLFPALAKGDELDFIPGQDASVEYLQLDELDEDYITFFRDLTRKRLEYIENKPGVDPVNYMFDDREAFLLAAYCANGIPRRYLEILNQSYRNLCRRSGSTTDLEKISIYDVENAVRTIATSQIFSQSTLSSKDRDIEHRIINAVGTRNAKMRDKNKKALEKKIPETVYFTVKYSESYLYKNLLLQGCLHDKETTRYKDSTASPGSEGQKYMLDLAVAFESRAIDEKNYLRVFMSDLKEDVKRGHNDRPLHITSYILRE